MMAGCEVCVCGCFMADRIPQGGYYNPPCPVLETQLHAMSLHDLSSFRPTVAAVGVRWLVLIVIMFGTVVSSIGFTKSHGLASIAAAHTTPSNGGGHHGHSHEDPGSELDLVDQGADPGHPHHAIDHSHDKAHALPVAWGSASPQLPSWRVPVQPWIEMVQASRLERPPMG